jgi:hypothetical protein
VWSDLIKSAREFNDVSLAEKLLTSIVQTVMSTLPDEMDPETIESEARGEKIHSKRVKKIVKFTFN